MSVSIPYAVGDPGDNEGSTQQVGPGTVGAVLFRGLATQTRKVRD